MYRPPRKEDYTSISREKPRVLIVDDEKTICDLLAEELEESGYSCVTVLNGDDAVTKLEEGCYFDMVLLDLRLPGISGLDVLREIQAKYSHVATIIITAVNDTSTAVKAMKLGALDFITKPFELDKVKDSLRKALKTNWTTRNRRDMDAIAISVEADLDPLAANTKAVVERTVNVARRLSIPEEEIHSWAQARMTQEIEKRQKVESALNKLKRNPIAQYVLGLTAPYLDTIDADKHSN